LYSTCRSFGLPTLAATLLALSPLSCAGGDHGAPKQETPATPLASATPPAPSAALSGNAPVAAAPDAGARPRTVADKPTTQEPDGQNLLDEVRSLYRVAVCGPVGDIPKALDANLIQHHCDMLQKVYDRYRKHWVAVAKPFFDEIRPKDVPHTVVYPFSGGDLVTALTVYPDLQEITTISLEQPGDVRHIETILPIRLAGALSVNTKNLVKLLGISYSNTLNLGKGDRAWLPGEIVLQLAALVVHGYEPTALRYFHINPDGTLHYLTAAEVEAEGTREPVDPEGAGARFADVEIRFRKLGTNEPERVARHIAQDLSNVVVEKTPGLLAYLESKGQVAIITKAASHLLWADEFSMIRDYVLKHAAWMVSDSTGVPPRFAKPAGYVQDTYGTFSGPAHYGPINPTDAHDFRHLFAENPYKRLPFKFGYGDSHKNSQLIVMHKP
jgi:hypothetical protein